DKRLGLLARDIVEHFEKRLEAMDGKAMVVCMSRRICVELYRELVRLRPAWHHEDDEGGAIKVVMTGSASDPADWQQHIRNKPRREALANRFRDATDPLKIVLVRDMWLTGFDAPSLHTMYVDKPMRGHGGDAGDRAREPGVQRQAWRPGCRLPGDRGRPAKGSCSLHAEWGKRQGHR
ncbi:MAG: type I restriction enzyme subunit R domain-containing protein, partial [Dongiaceae bacterium]